MSNTVLIGPALPARRRALVDALAGSLCVELVDARIAFRRRARATHYAAIILFDSDDTGIPNEPLLRHCLDCMPGRPIISVLLGARVRTAGLRAAAEEMVSYFPLPAAPAAADYALLAAHVGHVITRHAPPSRSSR